MLETIANFWTKHPDAAIYVRIDTAGRFAENLIKWLCEQNIPQLTISVGKPAQNTAYPEVYYDKSKADPSILTIPGVGIQTASALVAKIVSVERCATDKQLVGYFGIFPPNTIREPQQRAMPSPIQTGKCAPKATISFAACCSPQLKLLSRIIQRFERSSLEKCNCPNPTWLPSDIAWPRYCGKFMQCITPPILERQPKKPR